uniref:NADP-dependent oxidoreductase domain-containing protein n=1 Tax=Chromera velia CCMP2878 TaxID=1169474 RepID=A0A0G4HRV9_9ALVE
MRSLTRLTVLFAAWPSVSHGFSFARDDKFRPSPPVQSTSKSGMIPSRRRSYARKALQIGGSMVPLWLNFGGMAEALAGKGQEGPGATNRVVRTVNGIRHRALGGGDIVVSEMGLGTQRWVSTDFNGPDERLCHQMMDEAILNNGVNLIDTAEQYPIPSGPRNIIDDCEGSLRRLKTDYIDVYLTHWPARYQPQANWGQSLSYQPSLESAYRGTASFEEICKGMGALMEAGKIKGWGLCNDNAFGLAGCAYTAMGMGINPPVCLQGDFSLIDRKIEENAVFEASRPINLNTGFMAYNALAGGFLTGKYFETPALPDLARRMTRKGGDDLEGQPKLSVQEVMANPRGRHDELGWGRTLYRYRSRPAEIAAVQYEMLAKKNGMSLTELALRWCRQRASLTTTLVGHSSMNQLKEDLKYFKNAQALSEKLMWEIDRIHMQHRNPIFSSDRVGSDWNGRGEIGEPIP